jgi:hypothetical protein
VRNLCVLLWFTAGLAVAAAADEDRSRKEAAEADRLCAAALPRLQLTAGDAVLDNPTASVLRWTNPSAGRVYGNTYVWLLRGRPAAAGSMYRYFEPFRSFPGELVALTGPRLVARCDNKVVWRPKDEWKWHSLPGSAAPAATAAQRLVQMGALAKEFTVEMLDRRNDPKGENQSLRLLPRPLYRYDAEKTKTLDGSLYAFVVGTDPELLLLLECDTAAAKPEWRFGVGRMNRDAQQILHKGKKVLELPYQKGDDLVEAYRTFDLGLKRAEPKR